MEDTKFRERGRALRTRQVNGEPLTDAEKAELAAFLAAVDTEQREMLERANARADERNAQLKAEAQELRELLARQITLRERAEAVLDDIEREQESIKTRYEALSGWLPEPVA